MIESLTKQHKDILLNSLIMNTNKLELLNMNGKKHKPQNEI